MSNSDKKVDCRTHGEADATFVCHHLLGGEKLGFNLGLDPKNPYQLYPDAWCDECERVWNEEGEWNARSEKFTDIKLLCAHCYEDIRERNWLQDEDKLQKLIQSGVHYLEERQQSLINKFKLNDHEKWDWDQDSGLLIFSHEGKPQVEAEIHFSGSFSTKANTWMWAWANNHLNENVKFSSKIIQDVGLEQNLMKLASAHWAAEETDGWEMTSILAKELNAIGAYRTASENGFTFMVITKAKWVNKNKILSMFSKNA